MHSISTILYFSSLVYWMHGIKSSCFVLFIKTLWEEDLKKSWRAPKFSFFKNYLLLQIFFSWGSVYSNFGVFIPKISLFDVFSGFKSKHHLLTVLSTFLLTMICRKNVIFSYLSLSSCPSHMFYFKWHVFFPKCS